MFTCLPFLSPIQETLDKANIPYRVRWRRNQPPKPQFDKRALAGITVREARALKELGKLPFGGVLVANEDRHRDLLIGLIMAYPDHKVIVVMDRLPELSGMRYWLQQSLHERVGALTQFDMDGERVVLTTRSSSTRTSSRRTASACSYLWTRQ